MTLASVIIPVWNGLNDLPDCLAALAQQSYTPLEIVAVDNASADGSAEWIAQNHPHVRLIRNPENMGFGSACNSGLAAAKGDVLVLLNQDTLVEPEWLAALVKVLEENSDIGIAGSKAFFADGTIQHAGAAIDSRGAGNHIGLRQLDKGEFDRLVDADYVSGASLAMRRALYEQIGGFDPGFFPAYGEDVDLCYRARAAGWRVVYEPRSRLVHNERSAAATPDYAGALLHHRHRLRLICKHWPIERFCQEFLPAERQWLTHLRPSEEEWLAAAHHAYLVQLLNLGELSLWRQKLLGEKADSIRIIERALMSLRSLYPLHLMGYQEDNLPLPLRPLQEAADLVEIREEPFRSDVPIFGRWIAAFRQSWNRVSTEWYVRPMIRQQSTFNSLMWHSLVQSHQHTHDLQQRIALATTEYLAGHEQEMSELAQEFERLKQRLAEIESKSESRSESRPK